ncbi:hypothetical protein WICMUC_005256 [Wickerhamomyces mucosus]|uniref:Uncharacterized protein n=1 Tax=Wickerhamomyces mucosus TaxID=1378264 RepID=A0A9P8P9Y2_9ASCO|nr:hypothetical protein WICMUC_005256 [Wickerhamomyces mucosus]
MKKAEYLRHESPLKIRRRLSTLFGVDGDHVENKPAEIETSNLFKEGPTGEYEEEDCDLTNCEDQRTFLNTINNRKNEMIQQPHEGKEDLRNIPPSRLFLLVYPEEAELFLLEKRLIQHENKNLSLMNAWVTSWGDGSNFFEARENVLSSTEDGDLSRVRSKKVFEKGGILIDRAGLNHEIKFFKDKFYGEKSSKLQIHHFKDYVDLAANITGSLSFQENFQKINLDPYSFYKTLVKLIIEEDCLEKISKSKCSADDKYDMLYRLKSDICGVSILKTRDDVFLTKIWVEKYDDIDLVENELKKSINRIGQFLLDNLPFQIHESINNSIFTRS